MGNKFNSFSFACRSPLLPKLSSFVYLFLCVFTSYPKSLNAGTEANTIIQNQAEINYTQAGHPYSSTSNLITLKVDELIALSLVSNNPAGTSSQSPSTGRVLSFTLQNTGNGLEFFQLSVSQLVGDDFDVSTPTLYLDSNSNGVFDSLSDLLYIPGTNDPSLSPNAIVNIFIVSDVPSALSAGQQSNLRLTASSVTGVAPMGTAFPTLGDGGVDALMGNEGGTDIAQSFYLVENASAVLNKSFTVVDPDGGSALVSGAIVTYELEIVLTGVGTFTNLVVSDPIPANSNYEIGSLKLNNVSLTDTADSDAGVFNGTEIIVNLGALAAPTTQRVSFQVRIQ